MDQDQILIMSHIYIGEFSNNKLGRPAAAEECIQSLLRDMTRLNLLLTLYNIPSIELEERAADKIKLLHLRIQEARNK